MDNSGYCLKITGTRFYSNIDDQWDVHVMEETATSISPRSIAGFAGLDDGSAQPGELFPSGLKFANKPTNTQPGYENLPSFV